MKWIRYQQNTGTRYGTLHEDGTITPQPHSWQQVLAGEPPVRSAERIERDSVQIRNPVERATKIVCVGLNYRDHIRETGASLPPRPLLFAKFASTLNDPGGAICWSTALTEQVDYEAELAVVIGRKARHVAEAQALGFVAGYTCANDVSARDLQMGDGQWTRGKSLDSFCPMGPVLVTADEIPDPQNLDIRCTLNGELMQQSNTGEMVFGVASLISFCSQAFTLEPGDVILTGTPGGVGMARSPQIWMQDGDLVAVELQGIGRLENPCKVLSLEAS